MSSSKIYPNVKIGKGAFIDDFVILGYPPRGKKPGEMELVIGDRAVIRSHSVIYAGSVIGDDFQTGHQTTVREENRIGNNVSVGTKVIVEHHISIGNNVRIQGLAGICEYSILEDDCWIGPMALFANTPHPKCPKAKECMKGPTIKRKAIIGGHATLLPGVVVGEHAFVGAGCVVRKDVPPHVVIFGNPPRVVANVFKLSCPPELIDRPYREEDLDPYPQGVVVAELKS